MEKIGRTKIVDLLKRTDIGAMVNVKGWVRTRRGSKQVNFIALNDGSTINNLQVVVDLANFDEEMLKLITTGACISVNGEMVESVGSGQKVEVQAREWNSCARLPICVRVPILLVRCSVFVITWQLLSTSFSMTGDSSISIRQSLQLQTVKVPDRCFR